jgi:hypothetical protein
MAKASLNPDRAKQGGGGVEAGNYQAEAVKFANIKTDFRPNQLYLVMDCAVLDKDGDKVRGADNVEIQLSFGQKSLEAFHPGTASGPDDTDPQDEGDGVDAEGNTVWCSGDESFNKSAGAIVFMESLAKAGFPKATLDRCYAPDLVGLKFALATEEPKKLNEKYGLRLNTKPMKDARDGSDVVITYKVAEKWLNPNYLSGGDAKAKKANGKVDHEEAAKPTDPEEIAKEVLGIVAAQKAGEKNKIKSKQALLGFFTNAYTKGKYDAKQLVTVQKLVKDDDWIVGAVAELGGSFDEGVTTFPEA